jgi:DNA-binding transcriptional LysR family regulator
MSPDELPYLPTFAKAAELSSFTGAARTLGLTQAAVSQRIQALEHELRVALFERRGPRVFLTDAGHRLYAHAERILELHRQAREDLTGRRATLTGELCLAASSVPGEHFLPELLSAFRRKHTGVQVRASVSDTRTVLAQVERGQVHLGLVGGKMDGPHLEYRCFACDCLVLVVPAGHPWWRRLRVTLDQLAEQPLILREPGSASRWCLEQALSQAGKAPADMQVALELGSNEAIKEAVLRGVGLAVLSEHAVRQELDAGKLHALRVAGLPLKRKMFVVWDRRRALPIPARLFLDLFEPCRSRSGTGARPS